MTFSFLRRLARASLCSFALAAALPALAGDAVVPRGLKGLDLGLPKAAALQVVERLQLGSPLKCSANSAGEEHCQAGPLPASAGFTFARERVHYLALSFTSSGVLDQVALTMGQEISPARVDAFGEIAETLAAAAGANPQVFAGGSMGDVWLRWKDGKGELLLTMSQFQRGVQVQAFLRSAARAPDAFTKRSRGNERFLGDL
ncbi:hypothetical protein [Methylibium petroleiphilum]|uniref:Uncharacterized protein n=1 Tax=Methylibium petroleiphilum (strain ATCC BAA-1232 / LMG 22953 / PM1) TaxID=420662 RepID=A2SMY4_METPP|nr:hypothetical protein [Methylibium petroleiphilum]ABM96923.1 hypothetical protein Mpe_B0145 [Methylibium petroleiphilum PM1]